MEALAGKKSNNEKEHLRRGSGYFFWTDLVVKTNQREIMKERMKRIDAPLPRWTKKLGHFAFVRIFPLISKTFRSPQSTKETENHFFITFQQSQRKGFFFFVRCSLVVTTAEGRWVSFNTYLLTFAHVIRTFVFSKKLIKERY